MRNIFTMLLSLLVLSFVACENEDPTIIEGQVIHDKTEEVVVGMKIFVSGEKATGLMTPDKEITAHETFTDENGNFSLNIAPHEEVTNYHLSIIPVESYSDYFINACHPESCSLLVPGKKHSLTVRVKEQQ